MCINFLLSTIPGTTQNGWNFPFDFSKLEKSWIQTDFPIKTSMGLMEAHFWNKPNHFGDPFLYNMYICFLIFLHGICCVLWGRSYCLLGIAYIKWTTLAGWHECGLATMKMSRLWRWDGCWESIFKRGQFVFWSHFCVLCISVYFCSRLICVDWFLLPSKWWS